MGRRAIGVKRTPRVAASGLSTPAAVWPRLGTGGELEVPISFLGIDKRDRADGMGLLYPKPILEEIRGMEL